VSSIAAPHHPRRDRRGYSVAVVFAPYGRTVDFIGRTKPETFASTMLGLVDEVLYWDQAIVIEDALLSIVFLGLLMPLHPASLASVMSLK
jgi:hypothetical protein